MSDLVDKGEEHMKRLTVTELKDLIRYHFASDRYKEKGIKKAGLVAAATELMMNCGASLAAAAAAAAETADALIEDDFVLSDEDVGESEGESDDEVGLVSI